MKNYLICSFAFVISLISPGFGIALAGAQHNLICEQLAAALDRGDRSQIQIVLEGSDLELQQNVDCAIRQAIGRRGSGDNILSVYANLGWALSNRSDIDSKAAALAVYQGVLDRSDGENKALLDDYDRSDIKLAIARLQYDTGQFREAFESALEARAFWAKNGGAARVAGQSLAKLKPKGKFKPDEKFVRLAKSLEADGMTRDLRVSILESATTADWKPTAKRKAIAESSAIYLASPRVSFEEGKNFLDELARGATDTKGLDRELGELAYYFDGKLDFIQSRMKLKDIETEISKSSSLSSIEKNKNGLVGKIRRVPIVELVPGFGVRDIDDRLSDEMRRIKTQRLIGFAAKHLACPECSEGRQRAFERAYLAWRYSPKDEIAFDMMIDTLPVAMETGGVGPSVVATMGEVLLFESRQWLGNSVSRDGASIEPQSGEYRALVWNTEFANALPDSEQLPEVKQILASHMQFVTELAVSRRFTMSSSFEITLQSAIDRAKQEGISVGISAADLAGSEYLVQSIHERVVERNALVCGVSEGWPHFSYEGNNGWSGLFIDMCESVAASTISNYDRTKTDSEKHFRIEIIAPKDRAKSLSTGRIDILFEPEHAINLQEDIPDSWLVQPLLRDPIQIFESDRVFSFYRGDKHPPDGYCVDTATDTLNRNGAVSEQLDYRLGRANVYSDLKIAFEHYRKGRCRYFVGPEFATKSFARTQLADLGVVETDITFPSKLYRPVVSSRDPDWIIRVDQAIALPQVALSHSITKRSLDSPEIACESATELDAQRCFILTPSTDGMNREVWSNLRYKGNYEEILRKNFKGLTDDIDRTGYKSFLKYRLDPGSLEEKFLKSLQNCDDECQSQLRK